MTHIAEPNTTGKVIFKTNHGDLEVELWAKETPKACRNFVQNCLEGFLYNFFVDWYWHLGGSLKVFLRKGRPPPKQYADLVIV